MLTKGRSLVLRGEGPRPSICEAMIHMIQSIRSGLKSGCQLARRQNPQEGTIGALKAHQMHRPV